MCKASSAHKPDLGGMVPGSSSPGVRETFHEGLAVPTVGYWTRDGVVKEIEAIITRSSRIPETTAGDIRAQIGCTKIGADRIVDLCQEYGKDTIAQALDELLRLSEKRVRDKLAEWPDGESEAEAWVDDDGVDRTQAVRARPRPSEPA